MKHLTEEQQAIVNHNLGPALVIAVAGAGKTMAMVHRIERLVRDRVFPAHKMLATSFNKMAVADLQQSLDGWPHCRGVQVKTLHSLGYQIVQEARRRNYLPSTFSGDDDPDGLSRKIFALAVAEARKQQVPYKRELDSLDQEDFLTYIDQCKGNLRYADLAEARLPSAAWQIATQAEPPGNNRWYLDLYVIFEKIRAARGWITFDDMVMVGWELLVKYPDLLAHFRQMFDSIQVDEFQDVNLAQSEMIHLLAQVHLNLMVIGDEDQTIYEWRGASPNFILNFKKRYNATVYHITDNFRCKAPHLVLANQVIKKNKNRFPKALRLTQGFDGHTSVHPAKDEEAQGQYVADQIQAGLKQGIPAEDIAVLVRLFAQTPYIEQNLIEAKIPYRVVGKEPFYRRPEIVTLRNYVDLARLDQKMRSGGRLTPAEAEILRNAWGNIYNKPKRYISRETSESIAQSVSASGLALSQVLQLVGMAEENKGMGERIQKLGELLIWLGSVLQIQTAYATLSQLDARLSYSESLRQSGGIEETGAGKAAAVAAFIAYAEGKGDVIQLLAHLENLEVARANISALGNRGQVTITSIHGAKGLEWPVVFIPHCNQGTIPFEGSENLEEERRLLYVALTRARQSVYLSYIREKPVSSFLLEADYEKALKAIGALQQAFARLPADWDKSDTLHVVRLVNYFKMEHFVQHWWDVPAETKKVAAIKVLQFVADHARAGISDDKKIKPEAATVWRSLAPDFTPEKFQDVPSAKQPVNWPSVGSQERKVHENFRRGDRVEHEKYGIGTVKSIHPISGLGEFIEVDFQGGVTKYLPKNRPALKLLTTVKRM